MPIAVQQQVFSQSITNLIGGTAATAPMIGYLDSNKTQLEVQGTISQQDPTDYFKFAFRTGSSMTLVTNMNPGVRVQLMDASGSRVLADSGGTNAQAKDAFAALKKSAGISMKNGNYMLKVTYDSGTSKTKPLNYDVTVGSGSTFVNRYKTLASADTIQNAIMNGTYNTYSSTGVAAAGLTNAQSGATLSTFGVSGATTNVLDYLAGSYASLDTSA